MRGTVSRTVPEPDAGLLGVDGVQYALVPDLALGREAYHAPDVRLRRCRHRRRPRLGFRSTPRPPRVEFAILFSTLLFPGYFPPPFFKSLC